MWISKKYKFISNSYLEIWPRGFCNDFIIEAVFFAKTFHGWNSLLTKFYIGGISWLCFRLNDIKPRKIISFNSLYQPCTPCKITWYYKCVESYVLLQKFRRVFLVFWGVFLPKVHPSLKLFGSNFEDAEQNGRRPLLEKCNVLEHIRCVGLDWFRHFVSP